MATICDFYFFWPINSEAVTDSLTRSSALGLFFEDSILYEIVYSSHRLLISSIPVQESSAGII